MMVALTWSLTAISWLQLACVSASTSTTWPLGRQTWVSRLQKSAAPTGMLVGPVTGAKAGLARSTGDDAAAGVVNMTLAINMPPSVTVIVLVIS